VGGVVLLDGEPRSSASRGTPRVCLVRRARAPRAGCWSLPGGRVRGGETLAQALRRELVEETGLEVAVGALVEIVEIIEPQAHFVVLDYLCTRLGGEPLAGDDAADIALAPVDDLGPFALGAPVTRVIERALALARGREPG
jgi:mutator protein MutT